MELKEFVSTGCIPAKYQLLTEDQIKEKCIKLADYKKLSRAERIATKKHLICDDYEWVVSVRNGMVYISSKEDWMYKSVGFGKALWSGKYVGDGNFTLDNYTKSINIEGGHLKMADNLNTGNVLGQNGEFDESALDAILQGADLGATGAVAPTPGLNPMNLEENDPNKAQKEAELAAFKKGLQANKASVANPSLADFRYFNKVNARFVGFITDHDDAVKASTTSTPIIRGGKPVLTKEGEADSNVVAKHAKGEKVGAKYLEQEKTVKFTNSTPGKILGLALGMPAASLDVAQTELFSSEAFKYNKENKDLVYRILPKEEAFQVINTYLPGEILEDAATHGHSGKTYLKVQLKQQRATKKDIENNKAVLGVKNVLVHDKSVRSKLLTTNNWFPVKVYETIDISKPSLTAEEVALANTSLFSNLFSYSKGKFKYDELAASIKAKVKRDENGVVSSDFITARGKSADLVVPTYYNKDVNVANVVIPVKIKKAKPAEKLEAGKDKWTYAFQYVDSTKADDMNDAAKRAKSSFNDPRFATFRNVLGESLSVEALVALKPSRGAGKAKNANKNVITPDEAIALYAQASQGLSGFAIDGQTKVDAYAVSDILRGI